MKKRKESNLIQFFFVILCINSLLLSCSLAASNQLGNSNSNASSILPSEQKPSQTPRAIPSDPSAQENIQEKEFVPQPTETELVQEGGGLSLEVDSGIPPLHPTDLEAVELENGIRFTWAGTGSDSVTHYVLYQRENSQMPWEMVAEIPANETNLGEYEFEIFNHRFIQYEFTITAVDFYGNESQYSPIARVEETD